MSKSIPRPLLPTRSCFALHTNLGALILVLFNLGTLRLPAQLTPPLPVASSPAQLPFYDVVSIKRNHSGSGNMSISDRNGTFEGSNLSLKDMLLNAYDFKPEQLFGLPPWADTEHFDIKAKVVDPDTKVLENLTSAQREQMLQPLLLDRFKLKSHTETRVLPVYELVVNKGGPKFKEATADDKRHGSMSVSNTEFTATSMPISSLVYSLSANLQRVVIDKTGLPGKYSITLKWAPDDATVSDSPSLYTSLQEQLGLRLVPTRDAVTVFVLDHVEMPSEN